MKKLFLAALALMGCASIALAANPKSEFRGAWLHTVGQGQYAKQSTEQNKAYLRDQLDRLQKAGVNAVIFQVRPSADAFYASDLEPWSRFLSGTAGVPPTPVWDPLQFMVDEAHARGMELHAWLNPYRVTTSANETLPANHIYHKHPERFLAYDNKLYFDPGLPENREFIQNVVRDIVTRYDVDAIHMDDYFYPYPVKDKRFPDQKSFATYGNGMKLADWRRDNVNKLIEGIHNTIIETKPWVRFGISPFGVFRNASAAYPQGSKTQALQNYDDLYADVLLWTDKGWVDYMLPQLYWERGHARADYDALVPWWNQHANNRHMYVGEDVVKCMKFADIAPSNEPTQLRSRVEMTRNADNINGLCWWPGYEITRNTGGVADSLARDLHSTIALVPAYQWIESSTPKAPKALKANGKTLTWSPAKAPENKASDTVTFVVYQLPDNTQPAVAAANPANIKAVVWGCSYSLPDNASGNYFVTALNRANSESEPSEVVNIR